MWGDKIKSVMEEGRGKKQVMGYFNQPSMEMLRQNARERVRNVFSMEVFEKSLDLIMEKVMG
jgi:hypothetical protein